MSVVDYLNVFRRGLWLMVALAVLGAVLAVLYADTQPRLYRSYTSVMVIYGEGGSTTELLQGSSYVQNSVQTYALLATSPYVLEPVIDQLGLDETPAELGRRIKVDAPLNTTILNISVTDPDQQRVSLIADAVADSLTRSVSELSPTVDGEVSVRMETIAPATQPQSFISPDRRMYALLGAAAGLGLAVAITLLQQALRSRARTAADIAALIDVPTLGEVPRAPRGVELPHEALQNPTGLVSEAVRAIAANLRFVSVDEPADVVIVTSAQQGEGKTSVTAALGLTLAETGRRVLIVDADLRRPRLASLLGLEGAVGLTSVLVHDASLAEAIQPWGHENLSVLTGGGESPNPGQLISSGQLTATIGEARRMFDMVLIDSPPVLPVSDALWLAPSTDGVILVAKARKTRLRALQQAVEAVTGTRTPVLGVVVNGVAAQRNKRYYRQATTPPTDRAEPEESVARRVNPDPNRAK